MGELIGILLQEIFWIGVSLETSFLHRKYGLLRFGSSFDDLAGNARVKFV